MKDRVRRINLWGGPGVGKSTRAASLFSDIKRFMIDVPENERLSVELVREYAKEHAWEGRKISGYDQLIITSEQLRREDMLLKNGVDLIVTDSPIHLGQFYANHYDLPCGEQIGKIADHFEQTYPSINIFLDREGRVYDPKETYESANEASNIDRQIFCFLFDNSFEYHRASQDENLFDLWEKYALRI